jgi:hypothetical protein
MEARVSHIESYRRWVRSEDRYSDEAPERTLDDLVRDIMFDEPSDAMQAGTAFHKALELAEAGEHNRLRANGFTFILPDAEIEMPAVREIRARKDYGELTVSGQVDCVNGRTLFDHKTTGSVDLERYMAGFQWRFYLDLFGADEFVWNVFEIREVEPRLYRVSAPHRLVQWRYPGLHDDCARLAAEFLDFARRHMPAEYGL